jgi:hypothetical protein
VRGGAWCGMRRDAKAPSSSSTCRRAPPTVLGRWGLLGEKALNTSSTGGWCWNVAHRMGLMRGHDERGAIVRRSIQFPK